MEGTAFIDEHDASTLVGARIEVRTRFEMNLWAPGFEIVDVLPRGFQVRRLSDGDVLPEIFPPADIRLAGSMYMDGPFRNPNPGVPTPSAPARGAPGEAADWTRSQRPHP